MMIRQSDDELPVWEILPGESSKAYEAFAVYRDLGVERSFRRASAELGKSRQMLGKWSVRWGWVERVRAYDAYLLQQRRIEMEAAIMDMNRQHAALADNFISIIARQVIEMRQAIEIGEQVPLTPDQMARWFEVAVRIARLARGESTEQVAVDAATETGEYITFHLGEKDLLESKREEPTEAEDES